MKHSEKNLPVPVVEYKGTNAVLFERVAATEMEANTRIIVPDTHNAILIKDGQMMNTLGSGNHPVFETRDGKKTGGSMRVEIIWLSKTAKLKALWGTTSKFSFRDEVTGLSYSVGACGEYEVQIGNPRKAYLELIAMENAFTIENLHDRLLGRLLGKVRPAIGRTVEEKGIGYDRITDPVYISEIENAILPELREMFEGDYGLRLFSFTISNMAVSAEDKQRIEEARNALHNRQAEEEREARLRRERIEDEERVAAREWERERYLRDKDSEDREKEYEVSKTVGWRTESGKAAGRFCSNCGTAYAVGARFCGGCGKELAPAKKVCPSCGKECEPNANFCVNCGAKL